MRPSPIVPALVALLVLGSGCAFTPDVIRIEPEVTGVVPQPGPEHVVVRLVVDDLRPDPTDVVARKINGFGMQTATISSETPLTEVLSSAATHALQARGYRVSASGLVPLSIELLVLSHEFRVGFWTGRSEAQVSFLATLRDPSGRELFRQVVAETFSHQIAMATGENVKKAYEHAIAQALERLVSSAPFQQALASTVPPPVL